MHFSHHPITALNPHPTPTPTPKKSNLTFYCEASEAIRALITQQVGGKQITLCIYSGDTAALPPNELEVLMKRLSAETPRSLEAMRPFQPLPSPHLPPPLPATYKHICSPSLNCHHEFPSRRINAETYFVHNVAFIILLVVNVPHSFFIF